MKKINLLLIVIAASLAFASCKKDNNEPPAKDQTYTGTLNVTQADGSLFTKNNLDLQVLQTGKADSVVLYMQGVSFAEQMPMALNIKVPAKLNGTTLSGNAIVPLNVIAGVDTPFPIFQINNLSGTLTDSDLTLEMDVKAMQDMQPLVITGTVYPLQYSGTKK